YTLSLHDALPIYRWMGLFKKLLRCNVAQRALQRLVDAAKRVKQNIVRDHEGVLQIPDIRIAYYRGGSNGPRCGSTKENLQLPFSNSCLLAMPLCVFTGSPLSA